MHNSVSLAQLTTAEILKKQKQNTRRQTEMKGDHPLKLHAFSIQIIGKSLSRDLEVDFSLLHLQLILSAMANCVLTHKYFKG